MSRYLGISIFLFTLCISCGSSQSVKSTDNLVPSLYLNGENFDSAIINFESDYGYDRPDGDVLMGEFEINISEMTYRDGVLNISGDVLGTYLNSSEEKLRNAIIKLVDSQRKVIKSFGSDSTGSFDLEFKYRSEYILEFNYVGHRTLFIDLSKLMSQNPK